MRTGTVTAVVKHSWKQEMSERRKESFEHFQFRGEIEKLKSNFEFKIQIPSFAQLALSTILYVKE